LLLLHIFHIIMILGLGCMAGFCKSVILIEWRSVVPAKFHTKVWMKIHLYVSIFFMPVAMIFAVTGGLEIFGFHGSSREQTIEVSLTQPIPDDIDAQQSFVAEQLKKNNLPVPRGRAQSIRGQFFWGRPTGRNIIMRIAQARNVAQIRIEIPSFYNRLALLHEARGGAAFNCLAVGFAIAMIVIYVSGIMICWKAVKMRRAILLSLFVGLIVTAIAVFTSM
jgi:hypothetical protein